MNIPPTLAELVAPGVKFKVCDLSVLELAVMVWRCSDTAGSQEGSGHVHQLKGVRGKAVRGPGLTALIWAREEQHEQALGCAAGYNSFSRVC